MIRETDALSDLANRSTITVGHACVVASAKCIGKDREPTITWHLIGGRTTKSNLTAIAHARKINFLIENSIKAARNAGR